VFGLPWIAHTTLNYGDELKSIGTEFTAYPDANLWRDLAAANYEQLKAADEIRYSWTARIGRSKDTNRFERLYYLEAAHAKVTSAQLANSSEAISGELQLAQARPRQHPRADRGLCPVAAGRRRLRPRRRDPHRRRPARSTAAIPSSAPTAATLWFRPFGRWFANARLEAGEVFVNNRISVPDTILFRAGGDGSVRGYDYRTLGPEPQRRRRRRPGPAHRQRRARASAQRQVAGAARRGVRRCGKRRRPLGRDPPGVRLRRRRALRSRSDRCAWTSPTART
jgi:translocation and assembly module TamA